MNVSATAEMDDLVEAVVDDVCDAAEFLLGFCDAWTEQGWGSLEREFKAISLTEANRVEMRRLGELLISVTAE